ncbi:MAG: hypothetical protein M0R37_12840 [Bacteroidales bacterium]|nr:hypothetical protein [Bacteroidales bacterium]
MKRLVFIVIILAIFGCKKDDRGQLDKNAMISIWPSGAATTTKATNHLSNYEIVRQTYDISFYNLSMFETSAARMFTKDQRDTVNIRLLMFGRDIIDQFGNYVPDFIEGNDFVIRRNLATPIQTPIWDTIAYIPNAVIKSARATIQKAYAEENYTEVYRVFNEAFTFIPCGGEEWRALKRTLQN